MIKRYISILFLALTFFLSVPAMAQQALDEENVEFAKGIVLKVTAETENQYLNETMGSGQAVQTVDVEVTTGTHKGQQFNVVNQLSSNPAYDIQVKPGDRVILDIEPQSKANNKSYVAYIADKERTTALLCITALFVTLLLFIGGRKGLSSLLAIITTASSVFFVLIPGILHGYPIIPLTVLVCIISTLATMFLVGGFNSKSVAASVGTILSIVFAGFLSVLTINLASLSGFSSENAIMLWASNPNLDFTGILTSAMIIAALGAVMDIGMSISSFINEIKLANNLLTRRELITSGMNVGKDIIGTMSNTLILAYIGSSLPLLLLASNVNTTKFFNLNSVVTEIAAALVGSIGVVVCVPITAVVAAYLVHRHSTK